MHERVGPMDERTIWRLTFDSTKGCATTTDGL